MQNALQATLRSGTSLEYIQNDLAIKVKPHPKYPNLLHFSYNMIESPMGNPIVQAARGCILDKDDNWNGVCWGFNKFFNLGEGHCAPINWSTAKFYEKVDGSLCMVYFYDQKWHVATTGTPDGSGDVNGYGVTFSEQFWEVWGSQKVNFVFGQPGTTYMFELVGPFNQVVVQYDHGIRSLGWRDQFGQEHPPFDYKSLPGAKILDFKNVEEALLYFDNVQGHTMEGFVAVDADFNRVKIKHPGYVAIHRIKDGLSKPGIMELIQQGDSEEVVVYFPNLKKLHDSMKGWYENLIKRLEDGYRNVSHLTNRKEYAMAVQSLDVPFKNALYNLLSGKSIRSTLSETQTKHLLASYEAESECT